MKSNNKYREVLENILTNFPGGLGQYPKIYNQVKDVLKEPLRNCEVGSAEEQAKRFEDFCLKHIGCAEETGGRHCVGCPLEKASRNITQKCELYWSQIPYENKVKPCPFCGSIDIDYYETDFGADNPYSYVIHCKGCDAKVYIENGEYEDIVNLWNKRVEVK